MVVVPPGLRVLKNARFLLPPFSCAFSPIVMLPVKVVPVLLPNTTKSLVWMLAMSALVSVVMPADSMPKELLPVFGRKITAAAPASIVPPARLNVSALRMMLAVFVPPPLVIAPLFVRLSVVSVMASLVVVMPVTCRAPASTSVSAPPLVALNRAISFWPRRLVAPVVVVVSVSARIKPLAPCVIDAASSVTSPSVRIAAVLVPFSSMLPPALIEMSPPAVPFEPLPMRTPVPDSACRRSA